MPTSIPAITAGTVSRALANASEAQINAVTSQATQLGTIAVVSATAIDLTSNLDDYCYLNMATPAMDFPIKMNVGFSDFGTGQSDNHWGIHLNLDGESPTHGRWSENLENDFEQAGVRAIEKNWAYTSVDALTTYRVLSMNTRIDTHITRADWRVDDWRLMSYQGNTGGRPEFQMVVNADIAISTFFGALGVGIDPRDNVANGAVFKVGGSAGTGLEHVVIQPSAAANNATMLYINPPSGNAANQGYEVVSSNSDTIGNTLRNTHATGVSRYTIWAVGGDAATRWLTTNGDWAAGVDNSDSGAWKLAASFDLPTSTALRVDKTTLAVAEFGPHKFEDYTVGTVPSAAALAGHWIEVTNEVGGPTLARSNATNWLRVADQAIIST